MVSTNRPFEALRGVHFPHPNPEKKEIPNPEPNHEKNTYRTTVMRLQLQIQGLVLQHCANAVTPCGQLLRSRGSGGSNGMKKQ